MKTLHTDIAILGAGFTGLWTAYHLLANDPTLKVAIVEAEIALNSFFATAERSGCRKLLIVHGKGLHSESEPVLAAFVERWLARRASAGRSGHATRENGGRGATWVLLKDVGNQRSR